MQVIPYGREVGITYDWNGPASQAPRLGDALEGKTRFYLVVGLRRVNSRAHSSRWKIRGVVCEDDAGAERVLPIAWNRRQKSC